MIDSILEQLLKILPIAYKQCIVVVVLSLPFIFSRCSTGNVKKINAAIDIEMVNDEYNVFFDRDTEDEWRYLEVDSIAILTGRRVLLYGKSDQSEEKMWFYIAGGERELKKGLGNWSDVEFRRYRLQEIDKDKALYQALLSTKELWSRY